MSDERFTVSRKEYEEITKCLRCGIRNNDELLEIIAKNTERIFAADPAKKLSPISLDHTLKNEVNISSKTLSSIHASWLLQHVKQSFHKFSKRSSLLWRKVFEDGISLEELIGQENMPACIIARVLLNYHFTNLLSVQQNNLPNEAFPSGDSEIPSKNHYDDKKSSKFTSEDLINECTFPLANESSTFSDSLQPVNSTVHKSPLANGKVLPICKNSCKTTKDSSIKKAISLSLKDPLSISNKRLQDIVIKALHIDYFFGPIADLSKHEYGKAQEDIISNWLLERNISFYSEEHLRNQGYPKTPDFALVIPISFYCDKSKRFQVINWIESKGMFGSEFQHENYLNEQFWSYHNRFGPGLVIYWGGYVKEIEQIHSNSMIFLSWKLPEKIIKLKSKFLVNEDYIFNDEVQ